VALILCIICLFGVKDEYSVSSRVEHLCAFFKYKCAEKYVSCYVTFDFILKVRNSFLISMVPITLNVNCSRAVYQF
jgi:hypothetical protein